MSRPAAGALPFTMRARTGGGRAVECAERDRYGRDVAVGRVAGADVNAWWVAQGWVRMLG